MKVAIVHDDLVQYGGAERVLDGICEIFPDAPIYTSVYDKNNKNLYQKFGHKKIVTSFLQKIPGWKVLYKAMLPLYPIAFEQFDFSQYDLVISHTTRFAKSIITKPTTKHICYCHTPPRFLWHFSGQKSYGLFETLMTKLRIFDQVSATRVDKFLAGSKNAQARIEKIYHRDSTVVYPFIDLESYAGFESFDGDYFVTISRLNKYKRVDLAIQACLDLNLRLKVIGKGPQLQKLQAISHNLPAANIEFLGNVNDEVLKYILSGARALIIPGEEDFGLTAIEAQALGKPVIAFRSGGVLETVVDKKTGLFFDTQTVDNLKHLLKNFESKKFKSEDCKENANKFNRRNFIRNFRNSTR